MLDKSYKKCYNNNVKKNKLTKLKGGILLCQTRLQKEKLSMQC